MSYRYGKEGILIRFDAHIHLLRTTNSRLFQVNGNPVDTMITANNELMIYTGTSGVEVALHVADFALVCR